MPEMNYEKQENRSIRHLASEFDADILSQLKATSKLERMLGIFKKIARQQVGRIFIVAARHMNAGK